MAETISQPSTLTISTAQASLPSSSNLKKDAPKSFACALCDKVYKRKSDLKIHHRSHTGEKPFKCEQCDKAFPKRSHLTRHERTHAGIKPYRCGLCGKRHARASDLKVHLRTHSGERPYSCSICQKTFITSSHCRMHERTHDDTRCINCHLCEKTFKTRPGLKQHLNTAHNVTAIPKRTAATVHPTTNPSEPVAKAAKPNLVTSDGNSNISLDAIAKLCPSALQALLSAGVVQQKTKDAGATFVDLPLDSDDGTTDLLSGLMPFNPNVLDNLSLPELEPAVIPGVDTTNTDSTVPPLLNTLTACTMAFGSDHTAALWQQNARQLADSHHPATSVLQTTAPNALLTVTDTDTSAAHSPSSVSSVPCTLAPQATTSAPSTVSLAGLLPSDTSAGISLPNAQPSTDASSSISLLLHAANMSQ
eukprot:m.144015 g.144015  ORF g.144015 m.144015 type:complete len:419 (+) comp16184_c0_seq1:125-1381(+)